MILGSRNTPWLRIAVQIIIMFLHPLKDWTSKRFPSLHFTLRFRFSNGKRFSITLLERRGCEFPITVIARSFGTDVELLSDWFFWNIIYNQKSNGYNTRLLLLFYLISMLTQTADSRQRSCFFSSSFWSNDDYLLI